jgi:hypothetical protein
MFADLVERERATKADCARAIDALAAGTTTAQKVAAKWEPLALEIGATVTLRGLTSRAELNGREATVIQFRPADGGGHFAVQLNGASPITLYVKPTNLRKAASGAAVLARKWGPVVADLVGGYLECTRCGEPCTIGSKCRVPHPVNMRQDLGGMSGHDGMRSCYACGACNQSYTEVTPWSGELVQGEQRIEGAKWCFAGEHTTAPLPPSDERRIRWHTHALKSGPNLQEEIDALPDNVRTLTITSSSGFYDWDSEVALERRLANLTELQLVDVCFKKVILNEALTPSIRSLRLQNVPDSCELTLELPELRDVSIYFLGHCDDAVNSMLEHATALEKFDSYKLWVHELHFASNDLVSVDLHRSDGLGTLTLYAPNLRNLGLQGCFGLDNLVFRPTHPTLSASLPSDHRLPRLEINTTNANLGRRAQRALCQHGNVVRTRHQGMCTEGINMGMAANMGEFGGDDEDYSESDDEYDFDGDGEVTPDMLAQVISAIRETDGKGMPPGLMQMMMAAMRGMADDRDDSDTSEHEDARRGVGVEEDDVD